MKSLLIGVSLSILSAIFMPIPLKAGFYSGNELKAFCEKGDREGEWYSSGMCMGYIAGAHDTFEDIAITINACLASVPQSVTLGQIVAVVRKHMDNHPETLHLNADTVVLSALRDAFPCPK